MTIFHSPGDLVPLKDWSKNFNMSYIEWTTVFDSLFYCTTNNFKLGQFQYKVLMRISTCRYMRYKIKIEKYIVNSPNCSLCQSTLKTLLHIFLSVLTPKLSNLGSVVSKWYISKQFRNQQSLDWIGFKRWVKLVISRDCWLVYPFSHPIDLF